MIKSNIVMKEATLLFKNFTGKALQFNPEGQRNFCVILDPKLAEVLTADGWNVRWLEPRNEDDERKPYLQVKVEYSKFPPEITIVKESGKNVLKEEDLNILDWAEITNTKLEIRPYTWTMYQGKKNEKSGVKAYLKRMEVTLAENALEQDLENNYRYVPESVSETVGGCGKCEACDGSCKHDGSCNHDGD